MTYGPVCSGIEAATVAWRPLGWHATWFAEIDPFASAVLAHHYPEVRNFGDFTQITAEQSGAVDVLVGGTPCQSFSVAGKRAGLDDARGNLALEFCRLAGRLRPRWIVWENVPGVLSIDRGRAFGAILASLAELGYGLAWRVLDAQYFGVPQRRRRVFVVGHLGDWRRAAAVLLERKSLRRDLKKGRSTGEGFARDVAPSPTSSGGGVSRVGESRAQDPVVAVFRGLAQVVGPLTTFHSLRGHGCAGVNAQAVASGHVLPVAFGGGRCSGPIDVATACGAHGSFRGDFESEAIILGNRSLEANAVAFSCKDHGADAGDIAPTLRSMGFSGSHANGGGQVAVAFEPRFTRNGRGAPEEVVPPLKAQSGTTGKGDSAPCVAVAGLAVRRLTPRECERLQGFPDDHTLIPYPTHTKSGKPRKRVKLASDGPRYKAVGNSMAVPVMRWIGQRIEAVESIA